MHHNIENVTALLGTRACEVQYNENMPKGSLFRNVQRTRKHCEDTFNVSETYEQPYNQYYLVICPYGRKSGMDITQVANLIKKNYGAERILITRETMKEDGSKINPHYNVILTTKKILHSSNSNNLNMNIQSIPYRRDLSRVIDYIFKEYETYKPWMTKSHYFVYHK